MLKFDDTYMTFNLIGLFSSSGYFVCNYFIENNYGNLDFFIFFKVLFSYFFIISFISIILLFLVEYVILPYLKK